MSDIAIHVTDLSKRYDIGLQKVRYRTLRESINEKVSQLAHRNTTDQGYIWALKDINLEVKKGESLGIIGRNGAGKSTLLKILSRITKPTSGRAVLDGRVGSLLEVGTGFHPELTGRENVYLNGAILGMKRTEIERKFDEIVAFSEIEKFLDTPVKRYSSGMYVRLAFAVAAYLEPEILLVDEVLAVGDAEFQKKCLGKMDDVVKAGRTVIFVSHNMASVNNLCEYGIHIDKGQIINTGQISDVIDSYLHSFSNKASTGLINLRDRTERSGNGKGRYLNIRMLENNKETHTINMGATITIEADFNLFESINRPLFGITIKNLMGQTILRAYSNESCEKITFNKSHGKMRVKFFDLPLLQGDYEISLYLGQLWESMDQIENALSFSIIASDIYGTGVLPNRLGGVCFSRHSWEFLENKKEES
jgi:lipopolysaccharide transport system ATP-binding protein